ncbi:MAG: AMP-binding protein, partial [Deltaproteobacteria bacterium]|nr:AMP-binding protein [Deltaproteobacteria bacterium]
GDPVALALSRGPDLAAIHLAALAGAHPIVPLNTSMAAPEVHSVLDAARPKLVIATHAFFERHAALRAASEAQWWNEQVAARRRGERAETQTASRVDATVRSGEAAAAEQPDAQATSRLEATPCDNDALAGEHPVAQPTPRLEATPCSDDAPAIVLFTSGTTGAAKSVPLSHANLRANLTALGEVWQRSSQDRLLHILPAHHFHGLVLGLYGSLLAASTILVMENFDAAATLAAIPAFGVNLPMGVPTVYARMLEEDAPPDALAGLRLAISGSAPLTAALWERFHSRFGVALINRYGLTETGIVTSTRTHARRAGTVGAPLPGTQVFICTGDGRYQSAKAGVASPRGEICVRGASVTAGYGNAPDANAQSFRDGVFHTGDLGHFDEHGDLWVAGRLKELIIVGGSNVVPGEVETPLSLVEGVAEVVVAGAAHHDLGEIVVAYVVAAGAACDTERLERDLRAQADLSLAPYKRPRIYRFLDAIPRNAMGKVDRKRLPVVAA